METSKSSKIRDAVCLLSGGMDSTYAAYWAMHNPKLQPRFTVFYHYGQKGAGFEWQASKKVADELGVDALYYDVSGLSRWLQGTIMGGQDLPVDPHAEDHQGRPASFIPGRNLVHLSLLGSLLYTTTLTDIVGGWNAVDVDYPDCTPEFLTAAAATIALALGSMETIRIHAPGIAHTKTEIVKLGNDMGVPWELTRSCYDDSYRACGHCDSCLVRARAFYENDMMDPAYHSVMEWRGVVATLEKEGYLSNG